MLALGALLLPAVHGFGMVGGGPSAAPTCDGAWIVSDGMITLMAESVNYAFNTYIPPTDASVVIPLPFQRVDPVHLSPDLAPLIVLPVKVSTDLLTEAQRNAGLDLDMQESFYITSGGLAVNESGSYKPTQREKLTTVGWATLSFPHNASQCGYWGSDNCMTPTEKMKSLMKTNPPPGTREWEGFQTTPVWNSPEGNSDEAFSQIFFYGSGQHRLQAPRLEDDVDAPKGAVYAVYLDVASTLEARPGFATLGGAAYFDRNKQPLGILRGGTMYTPDMSSGEPSSCSVNDVGLTSCEGGEVGWEHAKMAIRGTLDAVVTVVDHLAGLHFIKANALATAVTESLPPDHPLQRMCTPFIYRTIDINYGANLALANIGGFVSRATGLTNRGLTDLFTWASLDQNSYAPYPAQWAAQGLPEATKLPLHEDGQELLNAITAFVRSYLELYYDYADPNSCKEDAEVGTWRDKMNEVTPQHDLPVVETCQQLEELLATLFFAVSAMHSYVGSMGQNWHDPCHSPWAWREGELCGTPRTDFAKATLAATTSFQQPRIVYDYSHVFLDEEAQAAWQDFVDSLHAVDDSIAARNTERERPFYSFMPVNLETAVSV